jgi:hypothetical protein
MNLRKHYYSIDSTCQLPRQLPVFRLATGGTTIGELLIQDIDVLLVQV